MAWAGGRKRSIHIEAKASLVADDPAGGAIAEGVIVGALQLPPVVVGHEMDDLRLGVPEREVEGLGVHEVFGLAADDVVEHLRRLCVTARLW